MSKIQKCLATMYALAAISVFICWILGRPTNISLINKDISTIVIVLLPALLGWLAIHVWKAAAMRWGVRVINSFGFVIVADLLISMTVGLGVFLIAVITGTFRSLFDIRIWYVWNVPCTLLIVLAVWHTMCFVEGNIVGWFCDRKADQ